ncbi:MAG: GH3 auxin-responsive promoter family protein [Pseudomonadota bacterium]
MTSNPSSILKLVQLINNHTYSYLQALQGATDNTLTNNAVAFLPDIIKRSCSVRVRALQHLYSAHGCLTPAQLFPRLDTVVTWTGGSCGTAIRQLRPYLPEEIRVVEYGYAASEFIGSVNVNANGNLCIPQLDQHYYEFVLRSHWESVHPVFVGIESLEEGEEYYVFVTTQSGLYRYDINDVIKAGPSINNCPSIEFLQKGKGVTNITGEKLSEYQLIEAVEKCLACMKLNVGGFLALANEALSRYDLYIEGVPNDLLTLVADNVDAHLRHLNLEYDDKRSSNRLRSLTVFGLVENACDQIKQWSLDRGVREVQYKPSVLGYTRDWQGKLKLLVLQHNE